VAEKVEKFLREEEVEEIRKSDSEIWIDVLTCCTDQLTAGVQREQATDRTT
jgi:hypothetical protein